MLSIILPCALVLLFLHCLFYCFHQKSYAEHKRQINGMHVSCFQSSDSTKIIIIIVVLCAVIAVAIVALVLVKVLCRNRYGDTDPDTDTA